MPLFKKIIDQYNIEVIVNNGFSDIYDIKNLIGEEPINEIFDFIFEYYEYIVFYHATATDNLDSYIKNGLLPMDVNTMNQYTRNIFNAKDFPEITDQVFQKTLDAQDIERREGIICFAFDKEELLEESSSHYLVYGSEYVLCIAQHLEETGNKYPKYLEEKLTPTIFKCKININDLVNETIQSISENLLVRYLEYIIYSDEKLEVIYINPYLEKQLASNHIISYEHPKDIRCDVRKEMYGRY